MGYHRAGFDVVGVDINPQPHYPFEFHQADAMTFPLDGFDAIHASPPCQRYSSATRDRSGHPDLYEPIRSRLIASGVAYVIENVIGAPYSHGIVLCGSMFGLTADGEWLQRHRNFETSWFMFQPACAHPTDRRPITVTGDSFVSPVVKEWAHSRQGTWELAQRLFDIDWMNRRELVLAIPPAYSAFIGSDMLRVIEAAA